MFFALSVQPNVPPESLRCGAAIATGIADAGITPSSGNVFIDLSFDEGEARVMALLKGHWKNFSMDMLLVLATRAELKPELRLAA